ncbi:RND family efflux transporter MFP subunit [Pseudomonas syringae pv. actinidiae ICMP 18804]|nr:RND family efflux transporter MFP subunit [Pseudomonas syringae pv. actinidiae ICMP 18804]
MSLAETPAAFRLGTAISVTLSSTITARMRLPINALQEVDGKRQIWIVDPQSQTVNPRAVNITSRDNDSFVLADGVKAGEKVVSAGVNSLKPGQKVKVDEESPR